MTPPGTRYPALLDVVRARRDIPEKGVLMGATGTVVHIHRAPAGPFEVEFCDTDGRTLAQVPLASADIEIVSPPPPP